MGFLNKVLKNNKDGDTSPDLSDEDYENENMDNTSSSFDDEEGGDGEFHDENLDGNNPNDSSENNAVERVSQLEAFSEDSGGILQIGKNNYAIGLFWQPINSADKAAKEAKELATSEGINADLFSHPSKMSLQIGLGSKENGHKAGMPSLAAHLYNSVGGANWIGLFKQNGLNYLIAVREDNILSDTDVIYTDDQEAIDKFNYFYSSTEWDRVFCPSDLGIEDTVSAPLESVLIGRPSGRLRPTDNTKLIIRSLAGIILIGASIFGLGQIQDMLFPEEEFSLSTFSGNIRERIERDIGEQDSEEPEIPPIPPAPWINSPSAPSFIVACVDSIDKTTFYYPGWNLEAISCQKDRFIRRLSRGDGTVNWIEPYITEKLGETQSMINIASRDEAYIISPIVNDNRLPNNIESQTLQEVGSYFMSHLDESGHEFNLGGDITLDEVENIYFTGKTFNFSSSHNPRELLALFSRVNTVAIDNILYLVSSKTWEIEGSIYEKRLHPLLPTSN